MVKESNISESDFEEILKTPLGHVYWKNRDGVILGANLNNVKISGFTDVRAIVGKTDFDLFKHEDALVLRANDLEVMRRGETLLLEETLELQGKKHIFLSHKMPRRDKNGNIIGVVGVSIDITEQTELLAKLAKKELSDQ